MVSPKFTLNLRPRSGASYSFLRFVAKFENAENTSTARHKSPRNAPSMKRNKA